jgi:hypothetical protein
VSPGPLMAKRPSLFPLGALSFTINHRSNIETITKTPRRVIPSIQPLPDSHDPSVGNDTAGSGRLLSIFPALVQYKPDKVQFESIRSKSWDQFQAVSRSSGKITPPHSPSRSRSHSRQPVFRSTQKLHCSEFLSLRCQCRETASVKDLSFCFR